LVISSIGSVPEFLPGIAMKGEYYTFTDEDLPRYSGADRVFGVGNVVTGQGNIRVSLVHSQKVTKQLIDSYLRAENASPAASVSFASAEARAAGQAQALDQAVETLPGLSKEQVAAIERRIHTRQEQVGYTSDYDSWIAKVTPPDLE
jgi:hypothetical protein